MCAGVDRSFLTKAPQAVSATVVSSGFHERERRKEVGEAFTDHGARLDSKCLEENRGIQAGSQGVETDK